MTSSVLSFSMTIGVAALVLVCTLLVMMPPIDTKWVGGMLAIPPLVMVSIAYLLRDVR